MRTTARTGRLCRQSAVADGHGGGKRLRCIEDVRVVRHVREDEVDRRIASDLADVIIRQARTLALTDRQTRLQVGKLEGGSAVAAIVRAQERKQRSILLDG